VTALRLVPSSSAPSAETNGFVSEENDVEVVLGSVQPLAWTKVPLRSARGLVLAEPVTPERDLHLPLQAGNGSRSCRRAGCHAVRSFGVERVAG